MVKVWINVRMSVISTTLFLAGATSSATGDFGHQFSLGLARNRGQLWTLSWPKAPRSGCWSTVPSKNQMRMVPTKLGRVAEKHEEPWEYQWTNKYKRNDVSVTLPAKNDEQQPVEVDVGVSRKRPRWNCQTYCWKNLTLCSPKKPPTSEGATAEKLGKWPVTVSTEMGEFQYLEGYAPNSSSCNDKWQIPVFVRKRSESQCLEGYDPKSS